MSTWSSLPSELLLHIFRQLDGRDALRCQLVCREWSNMAQQAAYASVRISKTHRLHKFVRTLSTAPSLPGNYVKTLTINHVDFNDSEDIESETDSDTDSDIDFSINNEKREDLEDMFYTLAQYTPWLENLQSNHTTRLFWLLVMQLRYEQHWTHVTQLPKPSNTDDTQHYRGAVLALRDTIKDVTLLDASAWGSKKQDKKQHNLFIKALAEFKQLKTLRFELDMNCSLVKLNNIIDAFSTMEYLLIESKENFTSKAVEFISTNTTLRRIDLKGYMIAPEFLVYLVTKFSDLKQLEIKADKCSFHDNLSTKDRQELAQFLLSLDQCEVRNMECNDMHHFIRTLKDEHRCGSLTVAVYLKKAEEDQVNYLSTLIKYNRKAPFHSQVRLTVYNDMLSGPLSTILSDYGETIDELQIKGVVCFSSDNTNRNPRLDLQEVLTACIKLERLELSDLHFTDLHLMQTSPIQSLSLSSCTFRPTVFQDISKCLPQLSALQIVYSNILDIDGKNMTKNMSHVYFDMPHTAFESFSFVMSGDTNPSLFKVTQETGVMYYKCREYNMIDATSEQYYQAHQHHLRTFHLQCKSAKHVYIVRACSTLY
ncbi:hypothetical protein CU098_010999 [Rhizopus stolonifer]|uniref:F-box domain-containing protein n=1 Tax=Rhizopus stolonifer TaxID=4846 RepID=A0A367KR85_RHIST|nr:hypothetical protein CU098_010999 [Rhizopus stolonifer]